MGKMETELVAISADRRKRRRVVDDLEGFELQVVITEDSVEESEKQGRDG